MQETSGATVLANNLTGLGIDEFFTRTDVPAGVTSNLVTDALGSTIALTDSSGMVQTEHTFEPFGKTTATGASNTNSFQYTGRENDSTGMYYYRARYYNPGLQRFISEDPIRLFGGDFNFYVYVRNNPLFYSDPWGLQGCPMSRRPCLDPGSEGPALPPEIMEWCPNYSCVTDFRNPLRPRPVPRLTQPIPLPPPRIPPQKPSKSESEVNDNSAGPDDICSHGFCWPGWP